VKSLEAGSCLVFICHDYLRLDWLTQLHLISLLQYLYVLIQSRYMIVSLSNFLLVFPNLMLQFLNFSCLMINKSLLTAANAFTAMQLQS
jgi:hypothetical protein